MECKLIQMMPALVFDFSSSSTKKTQITNTNVQYESEKDIRGLQ